MITIRSETPEDIEAIRAVHTASFPTPEEARLVDLLRAAGRLTISLVAEDDGVVVGHVAVTLVEGRERLFDLQGSANRLDDPGHPTVEVRVDLVRLPALGRATECVTDRCPGKAADGPVGQQVSVHDLSLDSQSLLSQPAVLDGRLGTAFPIL